MSLAFSGQPAVQGDRRQPVTSHPGHPVGQRADGGERRRRSTPLSARGCRPGAARRRRRSPRSSARPPARPPPATASRSGSGRSSILADWVSRPRWASSRQGLPSRTSSVSKTPSPRARAADRRRTAAERRGRAICPSEGDQHGWLARHGPACEALSDKRRVGLCLHHRQRSRRPRPRPTPAPCGITATRSVNSGSAASAAVWSDRSHRAVLTLTGKRPSDVAAQHLQPARQRACPRAR